MTRRRIEMSFSQAKPEDAGDIAELRTAVAEGLTAEFGKGHWSSAVSERSVLSGIKRATVIVGRSGRNIVGVLTLATRKPWAIDPAYFTPCEQPLYLTDMAVATQWQGRGIGRQMLGEARRIARSRPANAIRLDAYDTEAGAGGFYAACGFEERGRVVYRRTPLVYYEDINL